MSVSAEDIDRARALRDEAKELLVAHFDDVRTELSPQTIGDKLKSKATEQAVDAIENTREVVADNKVVVGLTVAGLVGWFARRPILALARKVRQDPRVEHVWRWRVR